MIDDQQWNEIARRWIERSHSALAISDDLGIPIDDVNAVLYRIDNVYEITRAHFSKQLKGALSDSGLDLD